MKEVAGGSQELTLVRGESVTERSQPAEERFGGQVQFCTPWVWCVHGDGPELDMGRRVLLTPG